eukprot:TRINITY_DN4380_c0_g1_i1.p1 TRINITY_DN4380_c0_g1~~TRINITY_DN4380_c0_g1_i1.p1  ORF type:complete len:667 (+),score=92.58 TRINITY_DN4380_c0_g1_i1:61-2001(+)
MAETAYGATILSCTFGWPTTYEIIVQFPDGARTILRRYSDWVRLWEGLGAAAADLPALPPKSIHSLLSRSFRDERQEGLERCLAAVIQRFPLLENDSLADFLEASAADRAALRNSRADTTPPSGMHGGAAEEAAARLGYVAAADRAALRNSRVDTTPPSGMHDGAVEEAAARLGYVDTPEPQVPQVPQTGVPQAVASAFSEPSGPRSQMDEIREAQRRRWQLQRAEGVGQAPDDSLRGVELPAQVSQPNASVDAQSSRESVAAGAPESIQRLQVLPVAELPRELDGSRGELLRETLQMHRRRGTLIKQGLVLDARGHQFAVVKCEPATGVLDPGTTAYDAGPPLPRFERIQFVSLRQQRDARDTEASLTQDYLKPHFVSVFSDPNQLAVTCVGETLEIMGLRFHVAATEPQGYGVIDQRTVVYVSPDDANEFSRIHVVPFSDTLPSAYDFDVFEDYVKPYFKRNEMTRFTTGQTFYHNGVQFKVVAADPEGVPCRVGRNTVIWCEGSLHPTAANLLSPEQAIRLSSIPPSWQMLLLNSDMFGDGTVAERIMRAQERRAQMQQSANTRNVIQRTTEERAWSQDLVSQLNLEQTQCVVCLDEFQDGDRVRALPCGHVFHVGCVDEWLGRDAHCPLCRQGLTPQRRRRR